MWVAVNTHAAGVQRDVEAAGLASQASLRFDCVPVLGKRPLLRGVAAQQALAAMLAGGRLTLAAELTGLAAACLAETLAHLRTRQQFDRSLGSFQSVQHRCVDLHLEIELASAAWQQADGVAVLLAKATAATFGFLRSTFLTGFSFFTSGTGLISSSGSISGLISGTGTAAISGWANTTRGMPL